MPTASVAAGGVKASVAVEIDLDVVENQLASYGAALKAAAADAWSKKGEFFALAKPEVRASQSSHRLLPILYPVVAP